MQNILKNYKMMFSLAKSDFKKRFAGSYFGIIWMFVQPLATILVYTLVFQVGFKAVPPVSNIPYVLWLIPGIIPWFYFQEAVTQGTSVLYEYSFLVKKVVFNVRVLPIVKLMSTFLSHLCFVIIMLIVFIIARVSITIHFIFIIYFSLATSFLALGIIYFTSSINVFFKDMAQIVNIAMQFGIWMAPIMYDESLFSNKSNMICTILRLNPFYYIVKGYRYSLIGGEFNNFISTSLYFWLCSLIIFVIGYTMFNKMKTHFSDVL